MTWVLNTFNQDLLVHLQTSVSTILKEWIRLISKDHIEKLDWKFILISFDFNSKFTSSFGRSCTVKKESYTTVNPLKIWSKHGERQRWNNVFPQMPFLFCGSVHIYGQNCTCVLFLKKKILLPHIPFYFICDYYNYQNVKIRALILIDILSFDNFDTEFKIEEFDIMNFSLSRKHYSQPNPIKGKLLSLITTSVIIPDSHYATSFHTSC